MRGSSRFPCHFEVGTRETFRAHAVLADLARTRDITLQKVNDTLRLIQPTHDSFAGELNLTDASLGEGYGIPTGEMIAATRLLASTEGLFVDPVYSGKAFAGLLADIASGRYRAGQNVLFIMTGGLPGLFAYRKVFSGE